MKLDLTNIPPKGTITINTNSFEKIRFVDENGKRLKSEITFIGNSDGVLTGLGHKIHYTRPVNS